MVKILQTQQNRTFLGKTPCREDIKLTHLLQVHFPSMVDFNRITKYSTVIQPIWNQ